MLTHENSPPLQAQTPESITYLATDLELVKQIKQNKTEIKLSYRESFVKRDTNNGTLIHNLELKPGRGGQLVRSAGMSAQLMAKENGYAQVRLPSGEMRKLPLNAKATIGTVGNTDHENVRIGKAGRVRHMGIRPTVRGVVMNPCDHPHGGGEGKSPVGMPAPVTPWGKPALGLKTRKHKKYSNKMIVKRASSK